MVHIKYHILQSLNIVLIFSMEKKTDRADEERRGSNLGPKTSIGQLTGSLTFCINIPSYLHIFTNFRATWREKTYWDWGS